MFTFHDILHTQVNGKLYVSNKARMNKNNYIPIILQLQPK